MMYMKRLIIFFIGFNTLVHTVLGAVPDSLDNGLKHAVSDTVKVLEHNRLLNEHHQVYERAIKFYRKGDFKTAVKYIHEYQVFKDSLNSEENREKVKQLIVQHEFDKENEAIKAELEQHQKDIQQQKTIDTIIVAALLFAAVLSVFIIRSNTLKRRANVKLENQHREILRINGELSESNDELCKYKDSLEEMVKEKTDQLRQSEIQLRTLSNNLPGGCIYQKYVFHDGNELFSYMSNTAEEWIGLSAETIMGDINQYYRQIVPEDLEKKQKIEKDSIYTMSSYSCEYRMMNGDQELWLLEIAMPRADKNQSIVWDGIIVNITDRKNFEKDLIHAKERAEESDRLKSSFLANMSHEIRTPINGIIGFLNFIERDDISAEKRQSYTRIIRSNIQQLLQLIGDIIDISKMDARLLALHHTKFDLNALLDELDIFFQDFILKRDKKIELVLDRSEFVSPCIIESDSVRIRQILSNLVGNAVKFTDRGYVRYGYQLKNESEIYFFVEDTGIGIPVEQQQNVFERFKQALDGKEHIQYGGTGLGLAISKNLVEMLGGQIGVTSEVDVGSTFHFTLPFC
jgi:signal transduction histidine kinase